MFSVDIVDVPEQIADISPQQCAQFTKSIVTSSYSDAPAVIYVGESGYTAALRCAYVQNLPFCLSDTVVETLLHQSVANFRRVNTRKLAEQGVTPPEPIDSGQLLKKTMPQIVSTLADRATPVPSSDDCSAPTSTSPGIPRIFVKGSRWPELIKFVEAQEHAPKEWTARVSATLTKINERDANDPFWTRFYTGNIADNWAFDFFMLDTSNRLIARVRAPNMRVPSQMFALNMSDTEQLAAGVCVVRQTSNNALEPEVAWFRLGSDKGSEPAADKCSDKILEQPLTTNEIQQQLKSGENGLLLGDNLPKRWWPLSPLFDWRTDADTSPFIISSKACAKNKNPFCLSPELKEIFCDGKPAAPNLNYVVAANVQAAKDAADAAATRGRCARVNPFPFAPVFYACIAKAS